MPATSIGAPIKIVRDAYKNGRRAYQKQRQRLPNREARRNIVMARHSKKKPSYFLGSLVFEIKIVGTEIIPFRNQCRLAGGYLSFRPTGEIT